MATQDDFDALRAKYPWVNQFWLPGARAGYIAGDALNKPFWLIVHPDNPPYAFYPDSGAVAELSASADGTPMVFVSADGPVELSVGVAGQEPTDVDAEEGVLVFDVDATTLMNGKLR